MKAHLKRPGGRAFLPLYRLAAAALLTGCASTYSPPPERPGADRCPTPQVWVCEDHYSGRIKSETRPEPFCRCQDPRDIH